MSIRYTEKGAGLHAAIRAAGHKLAQIDGEWRSTDDKAVQAIIDSYTLDEAKRWRKAEVLAIAARLRDAAVAGVSAGEMAAWSIKRFEAQRYAASGDPADAPLLGAEAAARGLTLAAIVSRVAGNAARYAVLEAAIAGADGRHRDAIDALDSLDAVVAYRVDSGWPDLV